MKNFNIYILLVLITIPILGLNAQDRNVVWVHGLGDDQSLWEHYETIFTRERQINSHRKTYNTYYGIDYAADRVINSVDYYLNDPYNSQNIAIGYSMGGLIIRDVDQLTSGNKRFGGLITVNSPNYGAPIANSISDGSVESAAIDACNKISAGPANQLLPLPWVILGNFTNDVLCNYFMDTDIVQNLLNSSSSIDDLSVGSTTINTINSWEFILVNMPLLIQLNKRLL